MNSKKKCPISKKKCPISKKKCPISKNKCVSTLQVKTKKGESPLIKSKDLEKSLSKLTVLKGYKRTHKNDPSPEGEFGNNDCLGKQRNGIYQGIIGFGGNSGSTDDCIKYKITWAGINKTANHKRRLERESETKTKWRADIYTFEKFILLDNKGPKITDLNLPLITDKLYKKKARIFTVTKNDKEWDEMIQILRFMFN